MVIALAPLVACRDARDSPSSPSGVGPTEQDVARQWSPYVGVHADGGALRTYEDALSALRRAGRLNGVRMEIGRSQLVNPVIKAVGALGFEVLGLVSNDHLFEHDIEGAIDRIFSAYPEIRYFQIGNEVTTILPALGRP